VIIRIHTITILCCIIVCLYFTFEDEAQEAEAVQVLNAIYDMREHQSNRRPQDLGKICHGLAMLYFILMDIQKVCML